MVWCASACALLIPATERAGRGGRPGRGDGLENGAMAVHALPGSVLLSKALLTGTALQLSIGLQMSTVLWRSRGLVPRTSILVALLLALPVQAQGRGDGYGRWQPALRSCRSLEPRQQELSCQAVAVDQRGSGVFRIRWGIGPWRQLTFVGTLSGRSEPMACRQAICRFQRPITLAISGVGSTQFAGSGVATGLPMVWSARGQCQLSPERLSCEARAETGERWSAEAQLR